MRRGPSEEDSQVLRRAYSGNLPLTNARQFVRCALLAGSTSTRCHRAEGEVLPLRPPIPVGLMCGARSGTLLVKPLNTLVKPEDIVEREYLTTLLIVVPKLKEKQFTDTYEILEDLAAEEEKKKKKEQQQDAAGRYGRLGSCNLLWSKCVLFCGSSCKQEEGGHSRCDRGAAKTRGVRVARALMCCCCTSRCRRRLRRRRLSRSTQRRHT